MAAPHRLPVEAFSGKVDAGFPKENATKYELLARFPIQPNRKAGQCRQNRAGRIVEQTYRDDGALGVIDFHAHYIPPRFAAKRTVDSGSGAEKDSTAARNNASHARVTRTRETDCGKVRMRAGPWAESAREKATV